MVTSMLQVFNLEQAEYLADAVVADPDVVRVEVVHDDTGWQVRVTRR